MVKVSFCSWSQRGFCMTFWIQINVGVPLQEKNIQFHMWQLKCENIKRFSMCLKAFSAWDYHPKEWFIEPKSTLFKLTMMCCHHYNYHYKYYYRTLKTYNEIYSFFLFTCEQTFNGGVTNKFEICFVIDIIVNFPSPKLCDQGSSMGNFPTSNKASSI
jgi:hypothetical protein